MRGVEDQIHLDTRRKAPRLVQARRIRLKRNEMHGPHSIPNLKAASQSVGRPGLGNISCLPPLPCPHLKRKRENGTGREVCISDPSAFTLAMLGWKGWPRKMGADGQVVGGCHLSPKSTATVTLTSRLAHLTDLRGRGPAAGSPPSVPRSPHLRTPSSQ